LRVLKPLGIDAAVKALDAQRGLKPSDKAIAWLYTSPGE